MKITNLNSDCLSLILERLDYDDLVNATKINEKLSSVAADVFRYKYSRKSIVIHDRFSLSNNSDELFDVTGMEIDSETIEDENLYLEMPTFNVKFSENAIELDYGGEILNLFKYFGDEIKKLVSQIEWADSNSCAEIIGRLISKYSSESLVDLTVEVSEENVLEFVTKPLINVQNLELTLRDRNTNLKSYQLNELFPALRSLTIFQLFDFDESVFFDYHIPNLEHLDIRGSYNEYKTYSGLISNNPQIRTLSLTNARAEYVEKVSANLPQLETLTLKKFILQNERIRFENVTTLTMSYGYGVSSIQANLEFPRLQTLSIEFDLGQHFAKHYSFLKELRHLKHLDLTFEDINDSQFKELTQNLTSLVQLDLHHHWNGRRYTELSAKSITEFLETHDKVQQLNVINFVDKFKLNIQKELERDWDMEINGVELSFKRKTNK